MPACHPAHSGDYRTRQVELHGGFTVLSKDWRWRNPPAAEGSSVRGPFAKKPPLNRLEPFPVRRAVLREKKDRRRESLLHIEDAAGEETLPLSSAFSQSAAAASIPRVSPTSFSVLMSKPTWSGTGWGQQLVLLGQPRACHPIREVTRTRVLTGLTGRPSVVLSPSVGVFFF